MKGFVNLFQLSFIFALTLLFIAVQSKSISNVTNITTTTERPNDKFAEVKVLNSTTSTENEQTEKYEIIDVSHGTKEGNQTSGRTTRIYTIGSVNDDFWLKHLGDDFKNAIHLQVGGNEHYSELFNNSYPESHREEVLHEYLPGSEFQSSPYQPEENFIKNVPPKAKNESLPPAADVSNSQPTENAQNSTNPSNWQKPQSHDNIDSPQSFESLFALDGSAMKFAHKYLQENSKNSLPVVYNMPKKVSSAQKKTAKNSQASASSITQTSTRREYTKSSKRKHDDAPKTDTKSSSSSYQTPNGFEEPSLSNLYDGAPAVEMDTAVNKPTDTSSQALLSYILRKPGSNYESRLTSGLLPYQTTFKNFNSRQHEETKQNSFERRL